MWEIELAILLLLGWISFQISQLGNSAKEKLEYDKELVAGDRPDGEDGITAIENEIERIAGIEVLNGEETDRLKNLREKYESGKKEGAR